jgi:RNA polymerase sigma-70 factor (ECF subfamily)
MEPDDEALVARARKGDDVAFRALFERHHRTVYRFVYTMTADHARAEDVVQDTFVAAYRGLRTWRGQGRLTTWLYSIARNLLAKSLRKADTIEPVPEIADAARSPEGNVLDAEVASAIARALLTLDEDKRTAFALKVIEDLSYEEIAEITGSAPGKLKTDVFRAKERMRELLADFKERG